MSGFVVVLRHEEPGVTNFAASPEVARLMRSQVNAIKRAGGSVSSPPAYLEQQRGPVISFTVDRAAAQVFPTRDAAQAAINNIPYAVRPDGLSIEAAS